MGSRWELGDSVLLTGNLGSVSRNSTHLASVSVGNWIFDFENSDMFINQRVQVRDTRMLRSHGLLGQTWREVTYPNAIKYVQGEVDDYAIREKDLWGDNFVFNAFQLRRERLSVKSHRTQQQQQHPCSLGSPPLLQRCSIQTIHFGGNKRGARDLVKRHERAMAGQHNHHHAAPLKHADVI